MLEPTSNSIHLYAHRAVAQPLCPNCSQPSARVHSQYLRKITDLPWARMKVLLYLTVRRFFCANSTCKRRTFTEQVTAVIAPYARRTERLKAAQRELAFASGGEAAARTAEEIGLKTSPDSFLRLIRSAPDPILATPCELGVDDWAFRKRHRYGTILIELERGKPFDLLPDRKPETVAK
jgi:transposase